MLMNEYLNRANFKLIFLNFFLTIFFLWLFQISNIDIKFQNLFFDQQSKSWIIDRNEPIKKFFFYQFPKIILAILIIYSLLLFILNKNKHQSRFYKYRHQLLLIFIGLSLIPLIVGNIKKFTNIYCPNQLAIFNGDKPYVKIFDHYPKDFIQIKKAQCFPAGHAVTGFALYILIFVVNQLSWKIFYFSIATFSGWILGFYQILKGAHFISDTLITMLLSLLLAQIISYFYRNLAKKIP